MSDATYEEATRCPKCEQPGEVKIKQEAPKQARLPKGTMIHTVYCFNDRCKWYNTSWLVQVNADGTVPAPSDHRGEPKVYSGFEGHDAEANAVRAALQRQVEAEIGGKGEIRNPFSR